MAQPNPSTWWRVTLTQENFLWLAADKVIRLLTGLIVGLLVARYLEPAGFGRLAYATAAVALLMPLAELGLDALVRRKLIDAPAEAAHWLGVVWRLRLGAGLALYLLLMMWIALGPQDGLDGQLMLILGLGLMQPAGMAPELWLQSNLKARRAVVMSWTALSGGAGLRLALIWNGAGLTAFAWAGIAEGFGACLLSWWAGRLCGMPRLEWGRFWPKDFRLLAESWPLLLAGVTVMLYMRIDMIMLRNMTDERTVGIYAACVRLSEIWYFIPSVLAASVLPTLLRNRKSGEGDYARAMQGYYDLSAALAYGTALLTTLVATPLVRLAYGQEYIAAAPVLAWHAWAAVFVFLGVARTQFLVNENLSRFHLLSTGAGAGCNILLNYWLIPAHGALGAAWATLVSYALAAWGATWLHPKARMNGAMQTRALLVPVLGWRYFRR